MKLLNSVKGFFYKQIQKTYGLKKYQLFYSKLFRLALKGLNFGNGGSIAMSGEFNVLQKTLLNYEISDALVIIDAGANTGEFLTFVNSMLVNAKYSTFTIHAFEPSYNSFNFLRNNVSTLNVKLNNLALSSSNNEKLILYNDSDLSGLASLYKRNLQHVQKALNKSEEITTTTLLDYCKLNQIKHIHYLKIDVEGHELEVLKGAKQLIEDSHIDYIQFEFGGTNIDSKVFFKDLYYLLNDKYNLFRIVKDGIVPVMKYDEFLEIFITINYLAIRKTITTGFE